MATIFTPLHGRTGYRCFQPIEHCHHPTCLLLTMGFLAVLCGCAFTPGAKQQPAESLQKGLIGTWMRPIKDRPNAMEGMRFDADGRFGLIGIPTMSGLRWRLENNELVVATVTERYPEPFETRLAIQTLTEKTLVLEGDQGYFRDEWHRDDSASGRLTGQVTYRERIALPQDAVLHLKLEDVSRQDVRATFIAGQVIPTEGRQVPIPFALYFAADAIDPRYTYQVRADILIDGKRRFLTTQAYPVLTRGHPDHLDITLQSVPSKPSGTGLAPSAGLRVEDMSLPSTYAGQSSSPSGPRLRVSLNLYPDRLFLLRKQVGPPSAEDTTYDYGRWYLAHGGRQLVLVGQAEAPYKLAVGETGRLRLTGLNGRKDLLQVPLDLVLSDEVDAFEEAIPMTGMFRYMADAPLFTDCMTDMVFPVAQENDYLALERAYLENQKTPGEPLFVRLAAHLGRRAAMEGDGMETVLVVDRFQAIGTRSACPPRQPLADLENTYWKLTELYGGTIRFTYSGRGEPHLMLRPPERQMSGYSGCNGFFGLYRRDGERLSFENTGATMMACPGNPDLEKTFFKALKATEHFKIFGEMLELYQGREVVARFEAVYF